LPTSHADCRVAETAIDPWLSIVERGESALPHPPTPFTTLALLMMIVMSTIRVFAGVSSNVGSGSSRGNRPLEGR
jgi:p-aminobenzoyl-glutamate transporter AbgT